MATAKSSCTGCKKVTLHNLIIKDDVILPPGLSESYCSVCRIWKIVVTDEALAEAFFAVPTRRKKESA